MKITSIKKDDIIFGKINVGNMPPLRAQQYIDDTKNSFKEHFTNDIILVGTKNGNSSEFEILRREL